jgi:hypothetical protein
MSEPEETVCRPRFAAQQVFDRQPLCELVARNSQYQHDPRDWIGKFGAAARGRLVGHAVVSFDDC